jgi:AraC family transcriptional regulator
MRSQTSGEPRARLEWVDAATGRRQNLLAGRFEARLGRTWSGIQVLRGRSLPCEVPEGHPASHVLCVNLEDGVRCEVAWPGRAWSARVAARERVHVFPARVPVAARYPASAEWVVVEIAPQLVDEAAGPRAPGARVALRPAIAAEDAFVVHVALALAEEARAGSPRGRLGAESLAAALALHLAQVHGELRPRAVHGAAISRPRLERVLEYIASNLGRDLSLHDLAGVAQMDVFRFVRAFKEGTGLPPHRFVLNERIDLAKRLLLDRALSISEVALRAGFATPSHFATTFRRLTHATPRAYRETIG